MSSTRKPLFCIDIDGTVANNDHRQHIVRCDAPDWDLFHSSDLILKDTPIKSAVRHFENGQLVHGDFLYLTARMESCRDATMRWLVYNGFANTNIELIMKPNIIRTQLSSIFKPSVIDVLKRRFPDREIYMVEDYAPVIEALDGVCRVLPAPRCWDMVECWPL